MIGNVEALRLAISNLDGILGDLDPETPEETSAVEGAQTAIMRLDGLFSP